MKYTPVRKTTKSAGADLVAAFDYVIPANQTIIVDTGYRLPENTTGKNLAYLMLNRSSNGKPNKLLLLTNSVGLIDEDYPDTIKAIFINMSGKTQHIKKGDSVVQLLVLEHFTGEFFEALDVERTGGLGSTGA